MNRDPFENHTFFINLSPPSWCWKGFLNIIGQFSLPRSVYLYLLDISTLPAHNCTDFSPKGQTSTIIGIVPNYYVPVIRHFSLAKHRASGLLIATFLYNGAGTPRNVLKAVQIKASKTLYRWVRVSEETNDSQQWASALMRRRHWWNHERTKKAYIIAQPDGGVPRATNSRAFVGPRA